MSRRIFLVLAKLVEWASTSLIPILTAVRATYPQASNTPSDDVLNLLHQYFLDSYVTVIGILGVTAFLGKLVHELINSESKVRMKATLDAFFEAYFAGVPESEKYTNRITLFKANRRRKLLNPYCRSGTQYQNGIPSFKIDSDKEDGNEGIVGQAWFRNATVSPAPLPECPNPWSDTDSACQEYAQNSLLSNSKAARLHVKSRSLMATPVRDFKGNQWGVLVLDSRSPHGIDQQKEPLVKAFAATLGKVL